MLCVGIDRSGGSIQGKFLRLPVPLCSHRQECWVIKTDTVNVPVDAGAHDSYTPRPKFVVYGHCDACVDLVVN
jgi:hypothetical protein